MISTGLISYGFCAVGFAALTGLLAMSWRGRVQGALLGLACLMTVFWAVALSFAAVRPFPVLVAEALEVVRDGLWIAFLARLLGGLQASLWLRSLRLLAYLLPPLLLVLLGATALQRTDAPIASGIDGVLVLGALAMALLGLVLLEQLYRNLRSDRRWAIKYLCVGLGVIFCFDLYLYSQVLLFHQLELGIWNARGVVNALAVPLIAISAARNPNWSVDVFISRRAALHTGAIMAAGIYLLAISAGGYYIRAYGGSWGRFAEVTFVAATLIGLLTVLLSGRARAKARVFVNKHFFNYHYDYREEWLRLIANLNDPQDQFDPYERAIGAVAQIMESPGGAVWLRRDAGSFLPCAERNYRSGDREVVDGPQTLPEFLRTTRWIVDLHQYETQPSLYRALVLPEWMQSLERAWLLIPLFQNNDLLGFMLLADSHAPRALTWEDRDLLKTLGLQIGSYLGQHENAQALSQARQFEAFNRMSAFLMHDLKNLIAQQSLVVRNAAKHKRNPAFIEDAIMTIDNSVKRMQHLLEQLQSGRSGQGQQRMALAKLLEQVVGKCRDRCPAPQLELDIDDAMVEVEPESFVMILGHIVRNAQDATPTNGRVRIRAALADERATVAVEDTGSGMDTAFLREKLFRPFFSTKSSKGMGIGAYQAREFIRAAGGDVEVTSQPGQGTCFRITLPVRARRLSATEVAPAGVETDHRVNHERT